MHSNCFPHGSICGTAFIYIAFRHVFPDSQLRYLAQRCIERLEAAGIVELVAPAPGSAVSGPGSSNTEQTIRAKSQSHVMSRRYLRFVTVQKAIEMG